MKMRQKFFIETLISVLLGLAIYFLGLAFFNHIDKTWDISKNGTFTLAPQSVEAAKGVPGNVTIYGFSHGEGMKTTKDELERYRRLNPEHISVQVLDPVAHPTLATRFQIKQAGVGLVELDKAGDTGANATADTGRKERFSNFTEQEITGALLRLSRAADVKVYLTSGHGERTLDENALDSLSHFRTDLAKEGYSMTPLNMAQTAKIPDDCKVLVIAGPTAPLLPQEEKQLATYLQGGGRLLLMLEPNSPESYSKIAATYGVDVSPDLIVIDQNAKQLNAEPVFSIAVGYAANQPIVKGFNQNAIFRMARPLTIRKDIPRGDSAIALAETAPNVFALPTALVTGQTQLRIDTAKYPPAAQTLIAVSTYPTNSTTPTNTTDKDKKPPETRVVTVGDVDFLSNSLYRILGNRDLSLNIVNWLGQSDAQISIRPKDEGSTPLRLTDTDTMKLMFIHIIAFPLLVLCGVFLSFRRRS